jgi:hypothetical protein
VKKARATKKQKREFRFALASPEDVRATSKLSPEDIKRILEADTSKGPVTVKLKGKYRAPRKGRS